MLPIWGAPTDAGYFILSYTSVMKTAISVPDDVFTRVEDVARRHGLNRSQFYTAAARQYADQLEASEVTAAINAVLDGEPDDESTSFAIAAGRVLLLNEDDEW